MYLFKAKKWFDGSFIVSRSRRPAYMAFVKDVFIEHHNGGGMDLEEAEDLYNEAPFPKVEKWLKKEGYDLNVWPVIAKTAHPSPLLKK